MAAQQTVPTVYQHVEDWPGNPGWWRFSKPQVVRATTDQLDRWSYSSDHRYYTCATMAAARRACGYDRAEWHQAHGA